MNNMENKSKEELIEYIKLLEERLQHSEAERFDSFIHYDRNPLLKQVTVV